MPRNNIFNLQTVRIISHFQIICRNKVYEEYSDQANDDIR